MVCQGSYHMCHLLTYCIIQQYNSEPKRLIVYRRAGHCKTAMDLRSSLLRSHYTRTRARMDGTTSQCSLATSCSCVMSS